MDLLSVVCTLCPCRLQYLTCIVASVDSNSLDCSIRVRSWVATLERSETKILVPASLANKVHIELPIVCMISTEEPTAFFTSWISAFAPSVTGRHKILAVRASTIPDKESVYSLSNKDHSSRYAICPFRTVMSFQLFRYNCSWNLLRATDLRIPRVVIQASDKNFSAVCFCAASAASACLVHLPGTHHVITSERFAYLYDSRKNVQKWWNRISARDSWQQVLRDMKTVEEEHRKEEYERQQQQGWQTEPQFVHDIHISHRQQEGTKSQTVLVAPPSTGAIITSISPAAQEHEHTSDHKPSSPVQRSQGGFFTPTEKTQPPPRHTDSTTEKPPSSVQSTKSNFFTQPSTPTTAKMHASSPSKTSQISPKEAPDKPHLSGFFKVSDYKDEAGSVAKPSPQAPSGTTGARQASEAVATGKPSQGSAKSPLRITEPDYSESESKSFGAHPQVDKPDSQKQQTPYGKPPEQRVTHTYVGTEAGEKQKSAMGTHNAQGETAKQSTYTGYPAIAKRAAEADQDWAPQPRAQELQSGVQDAQKQAKSLPAEQKTSGTSPLQVESEEDTQGGIVEDERFSTKRLRRMFDPDAPVSEDPAMEEEAPNMPSDVYDREKKTTTVPANKMNSSPPTGTRALYTPETSGERGALLPPKGVPYNDRATAGQEKTPPVQQVPLATHDKLSKTEGASMRGPQGAPQQTTVDARSDSALVQGADPRARVISAEQTHKNSTLGGRAPEATRKVSDSQGTSALIQEPMLDTRGKQAPVGQEEIPGVQDIVDQETTKKSDIDRRAAEPTSGSQQITEPVKGAGPSSPKTHGDKSTRAVDPSAALTAAVRAPASGGLLRVGNLNDNGKNEAAKPSPGNLRTTLPTTPGRPTQSRETSGQLSKPSAPVSSSSDTRNEKTGISETIQTSVVSPNDQLGGQATRNAGAASSVAPGAVKSPEDNKTYKEEAARQELPRDQSRAQLAENKKLGDDAEPTTKIGKRKDEDSLANTSDNITGQAQGTTNDAPSKLQIQSDKNKPKPSNDGGKQTRETTNSSSLSTPKEVTPSLSENRNQEQQLKGDRFGISLQENVKKGYETTPLGSGAVHQRKDISADADKNYEKTSEVNPEEKIPSDTQKMKNKSDSEPDSSSKPNKGNVPESERRGS